MALMLYTNCLTSLVM